jgi:RimK family alpha-L-glutamate ligase
MRMFIVGSGNNRYCKQLRDAALNRGKWCEIFPFHDITTASELAENHVFLGEHQLAAGDLVIVRSMPGGSLEQVIFRMDALWTAEKLGVRVLNSPKSLEAAIDKYLSLTRLSLAGIPTPKTSVCQNAEQAMARFEEFASSVVVKPIFGGEGRGIFRVSDTDLAWRSFQTLQRIGATIMLQEFIDHQGKDIRILLFGDNQFAITRENGKDWRTNISRGATATGYQATEAETVLATRAAQTLGVEFAGVDLIFDRSGRAFVLEVNAVPGWQGVGTAWNIDVADKLICWAIQAE